MVPVGGMRTGGPTAARRRALDAGEPAAAWSGVVVIGLIDDGDLASPVCEDFNLTPERLRDFVEGFPNSYRGSVCEDDYSKLFAEAVSIIDTTCEEYVPPAG